MIVSARFRTVVLVGSAGTDVSPCLFVDRASRKRRRTAVAAALWSSCNQCCPACNGDPPQHPCDAGCRLTPAPERRVDATEGANLLPSFTVRLVKQHRVRERCAFRALPCGRHAQQRGRWRGRSGHLFVSDPIAGGRANRNRLDVSGCLRVPSVAEPKLRSVLALEECTKTKADQLGLRRSKASPAAP